MSTTVTAGSVDDGVWHHVVVEFAGIQSAIYTDGGLDTVSVTVSPWNPPPPPGCSPECESPTIELARGALVGNLDEVALYSAALPSDAVANHYEAATQAVPLTTIIFTPGAGTAVANWGGWFIWEGLRNTLMGVRSSIRTPGRDLQVTDKTAAVMSVVADRVTKANGKAGLAQLGFVQTASNIEVPGCGTMPHLTIYTEFKPYTTLGSDFQCTVLDIVGPAITNHKYAALHVDGGTRWNTYLDGVEVGSLDVLFAKAGSIHASGEINAHYSVPWLMKYADVYGCFGCGDNVTPFQRTADSWTGNPDALNWTTVQRARKVNSKDKRWTIENLPSPFVISHPFLPPSSG